MRLPSRFLITALLSSLAACRGSERAAAADATPDGGTVVVAEPGEAVNVFPPVVDDQTGHIVQDLVFDRLAEIGPAMSTVGDQGFTPRLAKSWTWAPDSLSIAFAINPRARWHDGTPVTAQDVRYSFRIFVDSATGSPARTTLTNVDSISVRDSLTAVAWFKKRTPEQFYDLVYNLVPVPEHVYGKVPPAQFRTSPVTRTPVGSGRFRFVRWDPQVRIELMTDTSNYRGRARLDHVIFAIVPDPSVAVTQVLTGQADLMENVPPNQIAAIDSSTVVRSFSNLSLAYGFMGMNQHARKSHTAPHPILSDLRVRRALAMAVDRQSLLANVFGEHGQLSYGPFPKALAAADTTLTLPRFNTQAAAALLDSAGWIAGKDGMRAKNGRPLRLGLLVPAISVPRRTYAILIQEELRQLGIQVDIEAPDFSIFKNMTDKGDFDLVMQSYGMDPSVSSSKQNWSMALGVNALNSLVYSNRVVDSLLDVASSSFDAAQSRKAASRAYQTIINDVPAVFLYDALQTHSVNRRINIAATRPDGWWQNLADWSIPVDKRISRDNIGLGIPKS